MINVFHHFYVIWGAVSQRYKTLRVETERMYPSVASWKREGWQRYVWRSSLSLRMRLPVLLLHLEKDWENFYQILICIVSISIGGYGYRIYHLGTYELLIAWPSWLWWAGRTICKTALEFISISLQLTSQVEPWYSCLREGSNRR